jgi:D-psicose/D-tagatose/L-ribulose 3-epimerase
MKIGVSAFAWTTRLNTSHYRLFPKLREQGLEGFEIPLFDPSTLAASELRRALEANDLEGTFCAILPAGINPISPDSELRKKSRAHLANCVKAAAESGAHLMGGPVFAPNGYLPGRRRTQEEWSWAVECFQNLGDTLDEHEMTLSIEPVNRSESFFLNTAAEAKALCEAIGHPRIGVTVDTFHANIEEKNIGNATESLGRHLRHIHASENDRGLLGSGHIDFTSLIASLQRMNYSGYLMIEGFGYSPSEPDALGALWGDLSVTPEDIAFKGADFLRTLLSQ